MDQPSPGFYSRLFLVQKVTELETCHRSVNTEWVRHPYQVPDGDSGVGLGVGQEGQHDVLCRPQGCLLSDPLSSGFSAVSQVCSVVSSLSVSGSLFQPGVSASGLHQSSSWCWSGLVNGIRLLRYLVVAESLPLLCHHNLLFQEL